MCGVARPELFYLPWPADAVRRPNELSPRRKEAQLSPEAPAELTPAERTELGTILERPCGCVVDRMFADPAAWEQLQDELLRAGPPTVRRGRGRDGREMPAQEGARDHAGVAPEDTPMGSGCILGPAREQALFRQYNYCRYRVRGVLQAAGAAGLTADQAREAILWHRRGQSIANELARANLPLVAAMMRRMGSGRCDYGDLLSEGNLALVRAIEKFDASRGFKFSTYACRAILKAFSRLSLHQARRRMLFPAEFMPGMEPPDARYNPRDAHEALLLADLRDLLARNAARLTGMEQLVLAQRFGLPGATDPADAARDGLTLMDIGRLVGLTKERIRQIQIQALQKLRTALIQEEDRRPARTHARTEA